MDAPKRAKEEPARKVQVASVQELFGDQGAKHRKREVDEASPKRLDLFLLGSDDEEDEPQQVAGRLRLERAAAVEVK